MFYNHDMIIHDVQHNQFMSEGKTVDYPIDFDCNNGGSSSPSKEDESLFSNDTPRTDDEEQTSANELGPGACALCAYYLFHIVHFSYINVLQPGYDYH